MSKKEPLDYARIYYKLDQILAEKDKVEELEKEGYYKDGFRQLSYPTLKYKLVRIFEVLKEEEIDDINEMMKLIMQVTKGQNNPSQILEFLQKNMDKEN